MSNFTMFQLGLALLIAALFVYEKRSARGKSADVAMGNTFAGILLFLFFVANAFVFAWRHILWA